MLRPVYKNILLMLCMCSVFVCKAQEFYINAYTPAQGNRGYKSDIDSCREPSKIFICPLAQAPYADMAFDNQNLWYVAQSGSLYKRKLNDTGSCQLVCNFPYVNNITALVADSTGIIYAAGTVSSGGMLCKYDPVNGPDTIGKLPANMLPSGDLFFYKNRLFMTCSPSTSSSFYIAEIDIANPKNSHAYMTLLGTRPWSAFSVADSNKTRCYVLYSPDTAHTDMVEIDIPAKTESGIICTYNFQANGAASFYQPPVDTSLHTGNIQAPGYYLKLCQPSVNNICVVSNLSHHQLNAIAVFDLSGRRLKQFATTNFPGNLDISDIPAGMYILQVITNDRHRWMERVIKN